ncbi:hypothetical protein ACH50O_23190 (plasmid) [Methylomonas sp. 2BW1-5-20]|uniref:hypothetical protein n=1 Tax=Methylomonas sp. 2BW1-5-20 TaxID=3376686 RepID=UPI0040525F6D
MESVISKWAPTLLAGIISFFTAWFLKSIERDKYYKDKRLERADQTISNFSVYIENWKKLISIAKLAKDRELTENEQKRLERYISERDAAKHQLSSQLATLSLYFDKDVIDIAKQFRAWDQEQSIKRLDELPDYSEWEGWLNYLSVLLRKHI